MTLERWRKILLEELDAEEVPCRGQSTEASENVHVRGLELG